MQQFGELGEEPQYSVKIGDTQYLTGFKTLMFKAKDRLHDKI